VVRIGRRTVSSGRPGPYSGRGPALLIFTTDPLMTCSVVCTPKALQDLIVLPIVLGQHSHLKAGPVANTTPLNDSQNERQPCKISSGGQFTMQHTTKWSYPQYPLQLFLRVERAKPEPLIAVTFVLW
jgi:hypothetical protein